MDVVDAEVGLLAVPIVLHVLRPGPLDRVGHCVRRWPSIDNEVRRLSAVNDLAIDRGAGGGRVGEGKGVSRGCGRVLRVRGEDGLNELLVLNRASVL